MQFQQQLWPVVSFLSTCFEKHLASADVYKGARVLCVYRGCWPSAAKLPFCSHEHLLSHVGRWKQNI